MSTNKYIALIPAYKPASFLSDLAEGLEKSGFSVVIVDDGSGAQYEHLFFECSRYAEILYHTQNAGKGCALKTGLHYIRTHFPADSVIVTVDADGQHRIEDALNISKIAGENPATLVLGSRMLKKDVPMRSRFGNTVTRFVYRVTTGLKVQDTQTGLRAFTGDLIPELLAIPGERYEYEMNVLLYFAHEKISIIEREIETIYIDNNSTSHFDTVKDSVRIYKEILKFSASSLVGFLVDYAAYSLFLIVGCNLTLSNVIARIISAGVNFTLNRKMVFKSKEKLLVSALKYAALAVCILIGNTTILYLLVNACGLHQMLAKIVTEVLFFILSWLVQRFLVFRRKTAGGRE